MSSSDDKFEAKAAELAEHEKRIRATLERSAKIQRLLSRLSLWLGVAGAVAALFISSTSFFFGSRPLVAPESQYARDIAEIKNSLATTQARLDALDTRFKQLAASPDAATQAKDATLKGDLDIVSKKIGLFEQALVENPTKALSIPLLRQEVDTLKQNYQRDYDNAAKQVDRIYDQNKWFIGLMFSMAVGLVGLAVSNLIQARKKDA